MTVDMLAATFFWPEGTLLGPHHPDAVDGQEAPAEAGAAADAEAEGFWSAVMRRLWRPAPAASSAVAAP